jgi:2-polyprenyl-3-methyl-5-hydroxy-6-metoxy-1,4-benzoquinol methylase
MQIHCRLDRLAGLQEAPPDTVSFITAHECPVCRGAELRDISRLQGSLTTSGCRSCGHMFQRRRPDDAWYANWYRSGWDSDRARQWSPSAWRAKRKAAGARLLRAARRAIGRRALRGTMYDFCACVLESRFAVLDVGCGYGDALAPFAQRGCRVFGIEASPHRAQAASEQGVKTAIEPVERLAPDTFGTVFDLVISNHVIEHCVDPHAFMEGVCRVLRPGGWLCLAAPNQGHDFLIQNFFFALHIHHYSRTSMRRLLAAHGFTVQRFQEDHELRVLAQYRPSTACFSRLPVLERPEWTDRAAAEGVLGHAFDAGGRSQGRVHCRWRLNTRAFERRYDVRYAYGDEAPVENGSEENLRSMTMDWRGPVEEPLEFRNDKGAVAFWVK